ncbi:MAG: DUF4962 domain-containing protein [Sedimentisphaerales bacterium]|jgi:hypothetical protein|nr:DUF4962 domain-containing protein [Sedimentisphaerales bacterium]
MNSTRRGDIIARALRLIPLFAVLLCGLACAQALTLNQSPALPSEWGYRPADGVVSLTDPPSFSWRPADGLIWEIECVRAEDSPDKAYRASDIEFSVHCPPQVFGPGQYTWRYRGRDKAGRYTDWSQSRSFTIAPDASKMPLPPRAELLARIPATHPRLFLRPENLPRLRALAQGEMKAEYEALVRQCDRILADPPPTAEPPKYPLEMERKSEEWRVMWWGNRTYTIKALDSAATLAFTRLLGGPEEYGREAKRILLECAKWDPKGSTGYRYNDEAGMPYNYYFARTYSFVNDLLSEGEKQICRDVMKVRGDEMYDHLCPRHLWRPYASHSNRAWHFLGEIGIAFLGEIDGAEDWVWFATNVFFNVYPVWSDDDGGWHEGVSYWASYLNRFTWWADVMREAMGIDVYRKPFFSNVGYYAMYLMPPGKVGGGFGDLTARRTAAQNRQLMTVLAAQAQNPHWQWYVEQVGGPDSAGGYIGFVRGMLPAVQPEAPDDLPTSRLFAGTGQAYLNTDLTDAAESVQVVFKSSPFGTQSHGYEANNSFLLWAYGQRLLIRSGYRDIYGSDHHQNWMWSTRSTNCITVNARGQRKHTPTAQGRITAFETTPTIDVVVGDAGDAYESEAGVESFKRAILFVKPDLIVVYDRLRTSEPSTFEYWLHAVNEFDIGGGSMVTVKHGNVGCAISMHCRSPLAFEQTNEYDPNPRPRITLREWHLTARTTQKAKDMEFITVYRPYRTAEGYMGTSGFQAIPGGYLFTASSAAGQLTALLPTDDTTTLQSKDLQTIGAIKLKLDRPGHNPQILTVAEGVSGR